MQKSYASLEIIEFKRVFNLFSETVSVCILKLLGSHLTHYHQHHKNFQCSASFMADLADVNTPVDVILFVHWMQFAELYHEKKFFWPLKAAKAARPKKAKIFQKISVAQNA